jgi:3-oxo-5-alpha-steroid 4-dehydrogenase 3
MTIDRAFSTFLVEWFLILASASVLISRFIPILNPLLYYGKVYASQTDNLSRLPSPLQFFLSLVVPKSWFTHFYVVSCTVCAIQWFNQPGFVLGLMTIQSIRRLVECVFIEKSSPHAKIHVSHYIVGILFYISVGLAVDAGEPQNFNLGSSIIFVACSIEQARCHLILASLKKYSLPQTSLFRFLACPHYLMEIGIYAAFVIADPENPVLWLILMWVAINLSVSAEQTRIFYAKRYRKAPKFAIFPGIF